MLTVVGGKVVYSAGDYEGLAPPAPEITPSWSPVAHFGGFHATAAPGGLRQAHAIAEAAAASDEYLEWRDEGGTAPNGPAPEPPDACHTT